MQARIGEGVAIAGTSNELQQAILVNPYDPKGPVEGIELGLTMPLEERRERSATVFGHLSKHDINARWRKFLAALGDWAARSLLWQQKNADS